MPIEMIAARRCYDLDARKEHAAGDRFEVPSERAAQRLERGKKATRTAPRELPASIKTMAAPTPAEPAPVPVEPVKEEAAPEAPSHPQTYSRRDMQAAGPTGQAAPSPSSHRGRQSKGRKSTS